MKNITIQTKQFKRNMLLAAVAASFSACGVLPVSENRFSDDDIFFEEQVVVETKAATKTDAEVIEVEPEVEEAVTEVVVEEPVTPKVSFNSARGYWLAALEYLQTGEEEDAEWALEQALILKPNSKISRNLLSQIESDAINVLGEEYFEHTIQYGDSLSKLAKLHLDDPLQFYILAKYNQISNPSRLIIGQTIKIPGKRTQPVEFVQIVENPEINENVNTQQVQTNITEGSNTVIADATELMQYEEYDAVINALADSQDISVENADAVRLLVDAYYLKSQQLLSANDDQTAKDLLLKAAQLEPENVKVNMALIDLDGTEEAYRLTEQSIKALSANSPIEAYELINRALEIQPDYSVALEKREEIKRSLAMYYYKYALLAQRRQELDKAINYWDEVLALDENNQNAKLYRAKAVALKAKMKKFVSAL